ncbi:MAG: hypothetical protein SGJ27_05625 [Candidatus Melainabacteria bacterium]|nr:hypothetical protein [Candidatus Melainabacteria bacterium]
MNARRKPDIIRQTAASDRLVDRSFASRVHVVLRQDYKFVFHQPEIRRITMSQLHLAADNRAVAQPFRTRRDRLARCGQLGLTLINGDKAPRAPNPYAKPAAGSYADFARRAEERRNPTPEPEYVSAPCDVE